MNFTAAITLIISAIVLSFGLMVLGITIERGLDTVAHAIEGNQE